MSHVNTPADPFGGDFSQDRTHETRDRLPTLQWWGGVSLAAEGRGHVPHDGGWFMDNESIERLGGDPTTPPPGWKRIKVIFKKGGAEGWGTQTVQLAFVLTKFNWEERDGGISVPATEYEIRKRENKQFSLRGRTRAVVGVRAFLDAGLDQPVLLSVRGSYSKALNYAIKKAGEMAQEATKYRRQSGKAGDVPREAFWITLGTGKMQDVGSDQTSRVALPEVRGLTDGDYPYDWLTQQLVAEPYRRSGGLFDTWAEQLKEQWKAEEVAPAPDPADTTPMPEHHAIAGRTMSPDDWQAYAAEKVQQMMGAEWNRGDHTANLKSLRTLIGEAGFDPQPAATLISTLIGRTIRASFEMDENEVASTNAFLKSRDGSLFLKALTEGTLADGF